MSAPRAEGENSAAPQLALAEVAVALQAEADAVEGRLEIHLSQHRGGANRLDEAVRYSLLAGGKRLRPALCLWAYDAVQEHRSQAVWNAALAVEMIHSYSLIHDDLPAMDDDDLRRGRPSCHRKFDEATAILAGDALQSEAFVLTGAIEPAEMAARCTAILARAAGRAGMAGGQQLDLAAGSSEAPEEMLCIHELKTGVILGASLALGATCAGFSVSEVELAGTAGRKLGVAFQIMDDILDETGDAEKLGKSPGKDRSQGKLTATRSMGMEEARRHAQALMKEGQSGLMGLGLFSPRLAGLTELLVHRDR